MARTQQIIASLITICLLGIMAIAWQWIQFLDKGISLPVATDNYTFSITKGMTGQQITNHLANDKILKNTLLFKILIKLKKAGTQLQAGEYRITKSTTPGALIEAMLTGKVMQYPFTIVEGWTIHQVLAALHQSPYITHTLQDVSLAQLLPSIERGEGYPEGLFYPDTFHFPVNTSDIKVLQRAFDLQQEKLLAAWQNRDPKLAIKSPYQALIVASIIQSETGIPAEYYQVSGVYHRRLIKRMKLQADPTVIYGLGNQLTGTLTRKHLQINTPYNTYMYYGLPPTPIGMPSYEAILSALHPQQNDYLYFVANPQTGAHLFSETLKQHNQAVAAMRKLNQD